MSTEQTIKNNIAKLQKERKDVYALYNNSLTDEQRRLDTEIKSLTRSHLNTSLHYNTLRQLQKQFKQSLTENQQILSRELQQRDKELWLLKVDLEFEQSNNTHKNILN